jgi:hypothetical protein
MSDETQGAGLTPQENAFFDSKGTTAPTEAPATEAPATEAPATEQPTTEQRPSGEQREPPRTVPITALHEEREARKELERRLRETDMENARFRERFDILARSAQQPEKQPPKPEDDIFGAIEHVNKRTAEIERSITEQVQARQFEEQRQQVINHYAADAQAFASQTPDWNEAYQHLISTREAELRAMGITDPVRRRQQLQSDELTVAVIAMQNGIRPAEAVYNLALARGHKKGARGNGVGNAADKLATVQAGQETNRSLSSAGGSAGAEEMTAERLVKMPLDEFEAWSNKNPRKARQLLGG